ncbi:hypothetical protein BC781_102140 [Sediminitomix flava]|uniref:Uncharacterized protein n=1 Tax=Sediminitomix flava TaxID=379075 RepID=A0A315ZAH8_SEDFL|nr:hypothetical protein BC781_102140 [Sediminitomix flava]
MDYFLILICINDMFAKFYLIQNEGRWEMK